MLCWFSLATETKGVAEDAVAACVRMALEMKEAIAELNREWLAKGIRRGFEVTWAFPPASTVGNFGSEERMDYTIIGKQVNRPNGCKRGAAGEILIGQETWLLVRDTFLCVARNPFRSKDSNAISNLCCDRCRARRGVALLEDARPGFS
jgi:class 3 adenylate cyclase